MADIFQVGYGQMWLPPPQRADGGSLSVGYDVFDRFDLGEPRNETLYGTETSLKTSISAAHGASVKMYTDFIPNHNGFRNKNTTEFRRARRLSRVSCSQPPGDTDGDFHDPAISYEQRSDQRQPVRPDRHRPGEEPPVHPPPDRGRQRRHNIPAGTIWNKPDPNNARFYPDQGLGGIALTDPNTGGDVHALQLQPGQPAGRRSECTKTPPAC